MLPMSVLCSTQARLTLTLPLSPSPPNPNPAPKPQPHPTQARPVSCCGGVPVAHLRRDQAQQQRATQGLGTTPTPVPTSAPTPAPAPTAGAGGRGSVREIDEPLDLVRVRVGPHPHNPKPDPNQVRELDETLDEGIACGFSAVRPLSGQQGPRGRLAAPRLGLSAEVGRGWPRLAEAGRGWPRLAEVGRGWPRLAEAGRGWPGLAEGRGWLRLAVAGRGRPALGAAPGIPLHYRCTSALVKGLQPSQVGPRLLSSSGPAQACSRHLRPNLSEPCLPPRCSVVSSAAPATAARGRCPCGSVPTAVTCGGSGHASAPWCLRARRKARPRMPSAEGPVSQFKPPDLIYLNRMCSFFYLQVFCPLQ